MRQLFLLVALTLAGCSSPGAFFGALEGPSFTQHHVSEEAHALVYLYRPQNDWADQELEAPGIFLDNQLMGSLPSNGYLVLEFDPATYKLEMRRPLMGGFWMLMADGPLDFTLISSFTLEAQPGQTYYLRYDEDGPAPMHDPRAVSVEGPLQLVPEQLAAEEMPRTRQVQKMLAVAAVEGDAERTQRGFWKAVGRALDKIGI